MFLFESGLSGLCNRSEEIYFLAMAELPYYFEKHHKPVVSDREREMSEWQIVPWEERKLGAVLDLWGKVFGDRQYDFQIDEASFRSRVLEHPSFDPEGALLARAGEEVVGFVLVVAPEEGDTGYLSVVMVDPSAQGQGIGCALLERAEAFLIDRGKEEVRVGYRGNPISFATGADVRTPAYYFLLNRGFRNDGSLSLVMKLDLADFEWRDEIDGFIEENRARGIHFGLCGAEHREALCEFMEEVFPGGWEASVKRGLEGDPPYPVLIATDGARVVGFTGPVRVGEGGRGGFTGIGTHPECRRGKIGTVLFHLLCAEFKKRGAVYDILHTGVRNPAQNIYFGAGFKMMHLVDYCLVKRLT